MDCVERLTQREAYQIYKQRLRDGRPGDDKQDWFEARKLIGLIEEEDV